MCMKRIKWYQRLYVWFRRTLKWDITREIWFDDVPIEDELEIHSSKVNIGYVDLLCKLMNLGEYSDYMDDTDWFEKVKEIAHCGFDEKMFSRLYEHNEGPVTHYVLFSKRILEEAKNAPNGICTVTKRIDIPGTVPVQVIIHYGKGEIPYWKEPEFIVARVDQDYIHNIKSTH